MWFLDSRCVWISNLSTGIARQRWRPDRSLSLTAAVQEVAISHPLYKPYSDQMAMWTLSIKFIKGHILWRIMCFIPLTQTYYAPGWRWPYESHKAALMNMTVKSRCSVWTRCEGKVIWWKAWTAKMYAYKDVFGWVSKLLKYICCTLMDFLSPLEAISGLGFSVLWDWIKAKPFFVQAFVLCCLEVSTTPLPPAQKFHNKHNTAITYLVSLLS